MCGGGDDVQVSLWCALLRCGSFKMACCKKCRILICSNHFLTGRAHAHNMGAFFCVKQTIFPVASSSQVTYKDWQAYPMYLITFAPRTEEAEAT